jgi:hypothetical protein
MSVTWSPLHPGWSEPPRSSRWSPDRLSAELDALEASVDRAGSALACVFANSSEFEAAVVRAQRARGAFDPWYVARLHLLLSATVAGLGIALALWLV